MARMAADVDMRRRMGAAARLKYEQLFTPAAVLPVLLDFYERVVRRHSTIDRARNNGHNRWTQLLHPWVNG